MKQSVIQELIKEANKLPELKYSPSPLIFKENIKDTIKQVKRRLGILQTLEAEIDYELTLNHIDDEEEEFI